MDIFCQHGKLHSAALLAFTNMIVGSLGLARGKTAQTCEHLVPYFESFVMHPEREVRLRAGLYFVVSIASHFWKSSEINGQVQYIRK